MPRRMGLVVLVLAAVLAGLLLALDGCNVADDPTPDEDRIAASPDDREPESSRRARRRGADTETEPEEVAVDEDDPEEPEDDGPFVATLAFRLPGGEPVAGMPVVLRTDENLIGHLGDEVARGVTGPDGSVQFRVTRGRYHVRAGNDRVYLDFVRMRIKQDDSWSLVCGRADPLRVRVVNDAGEPVVGARVWDTDFGLAKETDPTGRADLGAIPRIGTHLNASAPGHVRWRGGLDDLSNGDTIRLVRGAPLRVRLVHADGSPIPDTAIHGHSKSPGTPHPSERTDAEGRAMFEGLLNGHAATLSVDDERGVRAEVAADHSPDIELTLTAPAGRTISGIVVEGASERPVGGAVVMMKRGWNWTRSAESDANGRFELRDVVGDPGAPIRAMAFTEALGPDSAGWDAEVPVSEGRLVLHVRPSRTIRGRIVDPDGRPVEQAWAHVHHTSYGPPISRDRPGVYTDDAGRFEISGIAAIEGLFVSALKKRIGRGWTEAPVKGEAGASIDVGDIVLARGFDLDVVFEHVDGRRVERARVRTEWRRRAQSDPMGSWREVVDGAIESTWIGRPTAQLEIVGPGFLVTQVEVDATTRTVVVDSPCKVSGRLLDTKTQKPVPRGTYVVLYSVDRSTKIEGNSVRIDVDEDGRFEAQGVRQGRFNVRFFDDEGVARDREVQVLGPDTKLGDTWID